MAWSKEVIHERYVKGYITDEQLARFAELGQITQEDYDTWYTEKYGVTVKEVFSEN